MIDRRTIGRTFDAKLDVYEVCKYTAEHEQLENCKRVTVHDVEYFDIVTGEDAEKIEAETDGSCIDDMHEYLVLHKADGSTGTFRNSYVDLFTR